MTPRFEQLIELHHDELFAYLWRLLAKARGSDVALEVEDLVQEVFLRAYESYGRLRHDSNTRAWLYKIATNCALTKLRRAKRWRDKAADLQRSPANNSPSHGRAHLATEVKQLVARLPAKQKACVTLRYLQDFDYPEIAEVLDCSEASARANVYQGLQRLRAAFKEEQ